MRIRAERDDLADVFARANRAVGTRSALPILQGLLCEAVGSTLRVTGTDLEMTVRTSTEVEVREEGQVVIQAKLAAEAVRKMPAGCDHPRGGRWRGGDHRERPSVQPPADGG